MVDAVIKLGGALLAPDAQLDAALAAIGAAARTRRLLIVPGGGPFADAVREVDRRLHISDDAAHWMAVLAMDQYAHILASRLGGGMLVADRSEIAAALSRSTGEIPVLAPYRWLREADPLPHSWTVTSDSIAAWVAGQVGARQLVLVKPPGAGGAGDRELVDPHFKRTLPAHIKPVIVLADRADALWAALQGGSA